MLSPETATKLFSILIVFIKQIRFCGNLQLLDFYSMYQY